MPQLQFSHRFSQEFSFPLFRLQLITPANALSQHIHTLSIYSSEKGVPTALIFESLEQPPLHVIMNKGVRVRERILRITIVLGNQLKEAGIKKRIYM